MKVTFTFKRSALSTALFPVHSACILFRFPVSQAAEVRRANGTRIAPLFEAGSREKFSVLGRPREACAPVRNNSFVLNGFLAIGEV